MQSASYAIVPGQAKRSPFDEPYDLNQWAKPWSAEDKREPESRHYRFGQDAFVTLRIDLVWPTEEFRDTHFRVYLIKSWDPDGKPDEEDLAVFYRGFVKWDGCINSDFHPGGGHHHLHACDQVGFDDYLNALAVLRAEIASGGPNKIVPEGWGENA